MKKKICFLVLAFFMFFSVANAKSEYYDLVWDYEFGKDEEFSGVIDTVKTKDGFISVGYYSEEEEEFTGVILFFDSNGKFVSKEEIENVIISRLFEENGKYYVLGINDKLDDISSDNPDEYMIYELSTKGRVQKTLAIPANGDVDYNSASFLHITSDENHFYFIDYDYYAGYTPSSGNIFTVKKDLSESEETYYSAWRSELDEDSIDVIKPYMDLHIYFTNMFASVGWRYSYYSMDFKEYKDGFLVVFDDTENETSYLCYEVDGEEKGRKEFGGYHINTVINFEDKLVITKGKYTDIEEETLNMDWFGIDVSDYKISVLDLNGNVLEDNDVLSTYMDTVDDFVPEYMYELGNGFVLSTTTIEDGSYATRISYFEKLYNFTVITDTSLGTVKIKDGAKVNEKVSLVVEPIEGYVLGEVKITDTNGNKIEVNMEDLTFVMPSSDVTIEVTFVELTNPKTGTTLSIIAAIVVLSLIGLFLHRLNKYNKFRFYN